MTATTANRLLKDTYKELEETDFDGHNVYLSIKGIGTKVFRNAITQTIDGWLFIWSREELYCAPTKNIGDIVCVDSADLSNICELKTV